MIITYATQDFVSNLKAALRAACPDSTRPHLACVRIELHPTFSRFVATNGHWLFVNDAPSRVVLGVDEKGKEILGGEGSAVVHVSVEDAAKVLRALERGKKAATWDVVLDSEARTVEQMTNRVKLQPEMSEAFPPYQQIIPRTLNPKKRPAMTYDFKYVFEITSAFDDIVGKRKGGAGITFSQTGEDETDPVLVTSPECGALVVLMPRRADAKPESMLARYVAA